MTAYARIVDGGPKSTAECPPCDYVETFERTALAQDAARAHNQAEHAYPEQTLEITEEDA